MSASVNGIVIRTTGSWHDVQVNDQVIAARIRGKLRLLVQDVTNPVAVGDRVQLRIEMDGSGTIHTILPRQNKLSRRAAGRRSDLEHVIVANVDRAWCVQSTRHPKLNPGFIDRFLVMAEVYDIPAGLIFNKTDLITKEKQQDHIQYWQNLYAELGYPVLLTSVTTGEGIESLKQMLSHQISVVTGPSGVGKSSLLNAIEPSLDLRIGAVSKKTRKGRHVTTVAQLYPIADHGYVVDTPGLREFGIWDLQPDELAGYFIEMLPFLNQCHFPNCTHDHEPDCGIKTAVEKGLIARERYASYLNILDSIHAGSQDVGR